MPTSQSKRLGSGSTVPVRRIAANQHGHPDYLNHTEAKLAREEAQSVASHTHLNFLIEMGMVNEAKQMLKRLGE